MKVVTTDLFVVKKEASGREGSEEWLFSWKNAAEDWSHVQ